VQQDRAPISSTPEIYKCLESFLSLVALCDTVDFAPGQEDQNISPCKDLKLVTCLVPEILV
jgi:hypothetical protein